MDLVNFFEDFRMRKVADKILRIKENKLELFVKSVSVRNIIGNRISKFFNVKNVRLERVLEVEP